MPPGFNKFFRLVAFSVSIYIKIVSISRKVNLQEKSYKYSTKGCQIKIFDREQRSKVILYIPKVLNEVTLLFFLLAWNQVQKCSKWLQKLFWKILDKMKVKKDPQGQIIIFCGIFWFWIAVCGFVWHFMALWGLI